MPKQTIDIENELRLIFTWNPSTIVEKMKLYTFKEILNNQIPNKQLIERMYFYLIEFEESENYEHCAVIKDWLENL